MKVFPFDIAERRLKITDVQNILQKLAAGDDPFIIRYKVGKEKIIQIINFKKHQNPHHTEKRSILPEFNGETTVNLPLPNGEYPADSLIPDSLIPDKCASPGKNQDDAPPAFSCKHFIISKEDYDKLLRDYLTLTPSLLNRELAKMDGWLTDNPTKHKRKARTGHIASPRVFIRNWLDRIEMWPGGPHVSQDKSTEPTCPTCGAGWKTRSRGKITFLCDCAGRADKEGKPDAKRNGG